MLALIKNEQFIRQVPIDSEVDVAKGIWISNAYAGWVKDDYSLQPILPAEPIPEGKEIAEVNVVANNGDWYFEYVLQDIHVPTPEELREQMPPISKRQLRLTLVRNGISLADLDAAIETMGDEAIIEWQDASEYRRLHPLLNQVAAHLSLSQEQVDGMWQQAQTA